MTTHNLKIKNLNQMPYQCCYQQMQSTIQQRINHKKEDIITPDELWLVEHDSVYTLGQAVKEENIVNTTNTPMVKTDRGGQVTWHGHGQLVGYFLFDLLTLDWNIRQLVSIAEDSICELLTPYLQDGLYVKARQDAPGVYVFQKILADTPNKSNDKQINTDIQLGKIASLGFKIKRGFSYHGIAININSDLTAFTHINPCGYEGMTMLNLVDVAQDSKLVDFAKLQQEYTVIMQDKYSTQL